MLEQIMRTGNEKLSKEEALEILEKFPGTYWHKGMWRVVLLTVIYGLVAYFSDSNIMTYVTLCAVIFTAMDVQTRHLSQITKAVHTLIGKPDKDGIGA